MQEVSGEYFMSILSILWIASLLMVSCGGADALRLEDSPVHLSASPKLDPQLSEINLAEIGAIAPKGRVQDREHNQILVVEQLIAHGKQSIPYLIGKLADETKIKGHVVDYWSEVRVGDVALIILTDFSTDKSWKRATIPGVGWGEFLGGGDDENLTGEQRLRNYVAKRGRKSIKERWQQVWETHKERIIWDEAERCFRVAEL